MKKTQRIFCTRESKSNENHFFFVKFKILILISIIAFLLLPLISYAETINPEVKVFDLLTPMGETYSIKNEDTFSLVDIFIATAEPKDQVTLTISKADLAVNSEFNIGEIYKIVKIETNGLEKVEINSVKIRFKVSLDWAANNSNLAMYQLINDSWKKLETKELWDDSFYVYYGANTNSFGYFAITAGGSEPNVILVNNSADSNQTQAVNDSAESEIIEANVSETENSVTGSAVFGKSISIPAAYLYLLAALLTVSGIYILYLRSKINNSGNKSGEQEDKLQHL